MKSKKNIFITGATGLLGSHILKIILEKENADVILLIRGENKKVSERRTETLIKQILKNKFDKKILNRIKVINGDVTINGLSQEENLLKDEFNKIDTIYHCAALTGFRIPLEEARKVNVRGTENVLEFAKKCERLRNFNYISTTFVIGDKNGFFSENDNINQGQGFNNTYEQSKFDAELLIEENRRGRFKIAIFRPSIITGDYLTGETSNFKMFYQLLQLFSLGLFKEVPASLDVKHNLIPVDILAKAIYILASYENKNETYHIINPHDVLCYNFMKLASDFFGYKNPKWVNLEDFDLNKFTPVQKEIIGPFIPYLNYKASYTADKTNKILKKYNFQYPLIDDLYYIRTFHYCDKVSFIKIKNRNSTYVFKGKKL